MTTSEQTLKNIQHEDEIRALHLQIAGLRQVISCAVCPICGEEIADRKWTIDDKERLICADCEHDMKCADEVASVMIKGLTKTHGQD